MPAAIRVPALKMTLIPSTFSPLAVTVVAIALLWSTIRSDVVVIWRSPPTETLPVPDPTMRAAPLVLRKALPSMRMLPSSAASSAPAPWKVTWELP